MAKIKEVNHYEWLEKYLIPFLKEIGVSVQIDRSWLITTHGDKADGYRGVWKEAGIPFHHGVAIYLLTYLQPWSEEVRFTKDGWTNPCNWVIQKYPEFKKALFSVESTVTIGHYYGYDPEIHKKTGYNHCELTLDSLNKVIKKVLKVGYNIQVIQSKKEDITKYVVYISNKNFHQR